MHSRKVLIVGGGFGGVKAALVLSRDPRFKVTLLSDSKDFVYYPKLYQAATEDIKSKSIIDLNVFFRDKKVNIIIDKAISLDRNAKQVITEKNLKLDYDSLILSLGSKTNYMGIPGLDQYSYEIKSIASIKRYKEHLHQQLVKNHRTDLNYFIIGAGPTGIELAGSLSKYLQAIIKNHNLKSHKPRITIVEAAPKLLPLFPVDTSRMVKKRLKRLGVTVLTKSFVKELTANHININDQLLPTESVVWTAGVGLNDFYANNNFALSSNHKVSVNVYLMAERDIYVIGDNANTPYSGMAQTALRDGKYVAVNLIRELDHKKPKNYYVKKPVTIIPVGSNWAAMIYGKLRIYGFIASIFRELADIVAYRELEINDREIKRIIFETKIEEECPVCQIAIDAKYLG